MEAVVEFIWMDWGKPRAFWNGTEQSVGSTTDVRTYRKDIRCFMAVLTCPEIKTLVQKHVQRDQTHIVHTINMRGCIQKFPDWPPGARTANDTALCRQVQLYRYFVSQSSEFCRHSPLCCFSTSVYFCVRKVKVKLSLSFF
jgi:hypothetical protein